MTMLKYSFITLSKTLAHVSTELFKSLYKGVRSMGAMEGGGYSTGRVQSRAPETEPLVW